MVTYSAADSHVETPTTERSSAVAASRPGRTSVAAANEEPAFAPIVSLSGLRLGKPY
jgi:hypothetical protein